MIAPSRTRSERSTSIVKSTWPGVSMMLIQCCDLIGEPGTAMTAFACGAGGHEQNVAADWIVMPRSRSSSIESIFAPTPSLPLTSWIAWIRAV